MVYTRNWGTSPPTNATLVVDVDDEINDASADIQQRVDSILTGAGGALTPPTVLSNAAPGDTRFATNLDPAWVRGDRVDLRGCTYRTLATSTDVANRASTSLTPVPIGNPPVGAEGSGAFFIVATPVSASSLCIITLQCLVYCHNVAGATSTMSNVAYLGKIRMRRGGDPGFTVPATLSWLPAFPISNPGTGVDKGDWYTVDMSWPITGLSAATRFEPQFYVDNVNVGLNVRGDISPSILSYRELI